MMTYTFLNNLPFDDRITWKQSHKLNSSVGLPVTINSNFSFKANLENGVDNRNHVLLTSSNVTHSGCHREVKQAGLIYRTYIT